MKAPSVIKELVEHFQRNRDACHSPLYNETQLRREFLDRFFEELGWDVQNKQGYSEAYKDVVHEDAIKAGEGTKAPDYCFRIGGTRKFFVEAKKPAINIREDPSPAFQLRRYAWSAKLPLSILTDFEEFAVYDCRIRPHQTDKASAARLIILTYEEYLERWEEIASIFSHDAVLKGSFDKYAESKRRRGTAEVDDAFLSDIEMWRKELAQNFALRNERLSQRELNFAVERTIDRIIFLRVCEDRGIEPYSQLLDLTAGRNIYTRLFEIFRRADDRYNSGLFHFQKETGRAESPDELTPTLKLDDTKVKDIIKGLYDPCPYEFSVLPADILGQVYEQFLGKVIRLTPGHQAKVEDKPEVKKAGGVYYTPTYIVEYIVKHTVGKLLEGKTPKEAAKLRILDPACGSGSFLIGAYQYLLDYHLNWYTKEVGVGAQGVAPARVGRSAPKYPIYQTTGGQWRLTPSERKRILLNNIYGVDIDPQAVEVTKLSLLLKVLEGESSESLTAQLKMFRQRALPDLGSNIKCGNSLIGPDFYDHAQMELLDDEEKYRINAFDWQSEFREVFQADARHLWLITFVTHNSRVSERMVTYGVKHGDALVFSKEEQLFIAKLVCEACKRYNIAVIAWNVLPDHIHMVIAAENEQVLTEHVRKIKGYSSYAYQKERKWESGQHVWTQKFHFEAIRDERALHAALEYVWNNRLKHQEHWGDDWLDVWGEAEVFASRDSTLDPNKGLQPLDRRSAVPPSNKGLQPLVTPPATLSQNKGLKPLVTASGGSILEILRDACVSVEDACCPQGGFDAVIGNPPYIPIESMTHFEREYHQEHHPQLERKFDSSIVFILAGLAKLKSEGLLGYISSVTWQTGENYKNLREHLFSHAGVGYLVNLPFDVFKAYVDTGIYILTNFKTDGYHIFRFPKRAPIANLEDLDYAYVPTHTVKSPEYKIVLVPQADTMLGRFFDDVYFIPFGSLTTSTQGLAQNRFHLASVRKDPNWYPFLVEGQVYRYEQQIKGKAFANMDPHQSLKRYYEAVPKLLIRRVISRSNRIMATFSDQHLVFKKDINPFVITDANSNPKYLLGIINSLLMSYLYLNTSSIATKDDFRQTTLAELRRLPIKRINFSEKKDKARHDKMVSLVERMLKLHKELPKAKTPDEKTRLERQITATDKQIDHLVYELYGLTEEEIKIVEGG